MNIWLKLCQINDASDSSMNEHLTKTDAAMMYGLRSKANKHLESES
jgi:hypothetical protein